MRSARHEEHIDALSIDREALRAFVDACQVLIGGLDANPDESARLVRELLTCVLQRAPAGSGSLATMNFRVARVLSYLEEAFADSTIHLASAARHVDITPSHLDRLLKEHTGLTFLRQLRRIRMRHAERLLLTTASSIKETGYACGYACTGSFSRDFRRTHGCSPRVWRDMRAAVSTPPSRPQ
jgi:two-component system response regulator YesN